MIGHIIISIKIHTYFPNNSLYYYILIYLQCVENTKSSHKLWEEVFFAFLAVLAESAKIPLIFCRKILSLMIVVGRNCALYNKEKRNGEESLESICR